METHNLHPTQKTPAIMLSRTRPYFHVYRLSLFKQQLQSKLSWLSTIRYSKQML